MTYWPWEFCKLQVDICPMTLLHWCCFSFVYIWAGKEHISNIFIWIGRQKYFLTCGSALLPTLNLVLPLYFSWLPFFLKKLECYNNISQSTPISIGFFLTKSAFLWGKLWKNWNCAVIFCHGRVLKGEITSPIYLSPTQAVRGDNPIVKK